MVSMGGMKKYSQRNWDPYTLPNPGDKPDGGAPDIAERAKTQAKTNVPGNYNPEFNDLYADKQEYLDRIVNREPLCPDCNGSGMDKGGK